MTPEQERFQRILAKLEESIDHYIANGQVAQERIRHNLDALIRIITAEHKNGKD